jgi:hypothetical protein
MRDETCYNILVGKPRGKRYLRTSRHILDGGQYRINRNEVWYKNLGWIRGTDEENLGSRKNEGHVKTLGEYKSNSISTTVRQLSLTGTTKKQLALFSTLSLSFLPALYFCLRIGLPKECLPLG